MGLVRDELTHPKIIQRPKLSTLITGQGVGHAQEILGGRDFQRLNAQAYYSPRGYKIGYVGGEKTMVVSGSRNIFDWGLNVLDFFSDEVEEYLGDFSFLNPSNISKLTSSRLSKIATEEGVVNVVGHSRGSRLVGDMDGNFNRAATDGAMIITHDKSLKNFAQDRGVDVLLANSGKNNTWVHQGGWFYPRHQHWLEKGFSNYDGYKYKDPNYRAFFLSPYGVIKKRKAKHSRY